MSKPGPKPTPGKVLEMRGSWRAKDRLKNEPGHTNGSGQANVYMMAPTWLSDDAKVIWKQVVAHLRPLGILGKMDTNALEH
jgi:phage terminase small subunit